MGRYSIRCRSSEGPNAFSRSPGASLAPFPQLENKRTAILPVFWTFDGPAHFHAPMPALILSLVRGRSCIRTPVALRIAFAKCRCRWPLRRLARAGERLAGPVDGCTSILAGRPGTRMIGQSRRGRHERLVCARCKAAPDRGRLAALGQPLLLHLHSLRLGRMTAMRSFSRSASPCAGNSAGQSPTRALGPRTKPLRGIGAFC